MEAGTRFQLNLDHEGDLLGGPILPDKLNIGGGFIKNIVEKEVSSTPIAPTLPSNASSTTGFPQHKKRVPRQSAFRQQRAAAAGGGRSRPSGPSTIGPPPPPQKSLLPKSAPSSMPDEYKSERQKISDENDARIAAMSPEAIEKARKELMANLSPNLIQKLLNRATLDDPNINASGWNTEGSKLRRPMRGPEPEPVHIPRAPRKAAVEDANEEEEEELDLDNRAPRTLPAGETLKAAPAKIPIHLPKPPSMPEPDPDSPNFFEQLHEKYYPDLPADPSKLSWMAPLREEEDEAYHPSLATLSPSALRFDFKANILPPRTAREVPVHLGLHHHGDAPGAAGYTIPELSHLARSSFPTQRCMAIQILGRILYRLGIGAYMNEDINQGLWKALHEGRVIDGLEEAASGKYTSHMSVKAYATEALW